MSHVPEKELNPAFPVSTDNYHYEGMTLRDYFAAKAMAAMVSIGWKVGSERIPEVAYTLADAMLKEREK